MNDEKTYKTVESNCGAKIMKGIVKVIEKYKDNLTTTTTTKEYLIIFWYNTSIFYGLPKIHKSKLIQNVINEELKEYVHSITLFARQDHWPHIFGLEALDYWLENHPENLHARLKKEFVLECAKFILQNNNMKSNNEFYNQIKVTAMGAIFVPTYAIFRWDILKSNFIVSALLNTDNF